MSTLVVATRRSALALAQCRGWVRELRVRYPELTVEELHVTTTGDQVQDRPLSELGGKGLFTKEIEQALLEGRADIAVHSMKDLPALMDPGLVIGCVPMREDPRDILVSRSGKSFEELATGATVGTGSLRRRAQLCNWRSDVMVIPLRGNVDTRLRKCSEGQVDAVVLARAGLARLGLLDRVTQVLDVERMLPAIGQGALAIQRRAADDRVKELLAPLSHSDTATAVAAERGVLEAVEADCTTPVAAYAVRDGERLWLRAALADSDCNRLRRLEMRIGWPPRDEEARVAGLELGRELVGG
ncbi:MAG TPA: hydroxymethylbilane synthase [Polyangiaceae bacterium]